MVAEVNLLAHDILRNRITARRRVLSLLNRITDRRPGLSLVYKIGRMGERRRAERKHKRGSEDNFGGDFHRSTPLD